MASIDSQPTPWYSQWREQMPVASRFAYFDHAAVGPLFGPSARAVQKFSSQASELGDTVWPEWNREYGTVRQHAAKILATDEKDVYVVPNTTTGINTVAMGFDFRSGDNVVLPDGEFPSNLFPWWNQRHRGVEVRLVKRRPSQSGGPEDAVLVDDLLDACDSKTRIIALSWVGYATGFRVDLANLVERAHQRGILVFLDAIQGFGVYPLSLEQTPVDFLSADGHKWLLGPEGIGVAVVRQKHLDLVRPSNVGWASVKNAHSYSDPQFDLRDDAIRYESGSPNMMGASALAKSMRYFCQLREQHGDSVIADRVLDLASEITLRLRSLGATIWRSSDRKHQSGILCVTTEGKDPAELRQFLLDRDVVVSCRGGGVRIAVHAYNNEEDIDRLVDGFHSCCR